MPTINQFQEFEMRVGTITSAKIHPTARKPAYQLEIDFGDTGTLRSSAQLTSRYRPGDLVGRQVIAVVNFPPRHVAGFASEVLVLGAMVSSQDTVLLQPDRPVPDGTRIA